MSSLSDIETVSTDGFFIALLSFPLRAEYFLQALQ